MLEEAIEVFKLNIEVYPESANPYDSLGEAYVASGDKELAIKSYERALVVDPNLPSAIDALDKLHALAE
jgi:tetratricopeptide (TPR) repeat protein